MKCLHPLNRAYRASLQRFRSHMSTGFDPRRLRRWPSPGLYREFLKQFDAPDLRGDRPLTAEELKAISEESDRLVKEIREGR